MKKILLGFLAAATFLVGCNKNEDTPNNTFLKTQTCQRN